MINRDRFRDVTNKYNYFQRQHHDVVNDTKVVLKTIRTKK